jgi:hypothetical protein
MGTTGREPVDQVIRLRKFRAQHPQWRIRSERDGFLVIWHARNDADNKEIKVFNELSALLDDLEARVAS